MGLWGYTRALQVLGPAPGPAGPGAGEEGPLDWSTPGPSSHPPPALAPQAPGPVHRRRNPL
eukprot:NODE_4534_length_791_cov_9.885445_g3767_i0.p5 GENE.NODE_4534_length_791_cov_9.885445_g3767_i0~~NODE_4534_length_791_cov_9.885445_g3767_i0.p5  ORF type:complete len:61 (-),score=5.37 NODE_4534_length_791_cov_9.885445_g3767_i0:48-230(-)